MGDLLSYQTEPRTWANKIVALAHNAKAFVLHFSFNRAILLKWKPEIINNGLKIMCMKLEHLVFLDSGCFIPCPMRNLPEAYGPSSSKSWYPHYLITEENLDYVGPFPEVSYYGVNEMGEEDRREFFAWYESQGSEL